VCVYTYVYRYVHVASIESNVSEVRQETAAYCSRDGAAERSDASAESSQRRAVRSQRATVRSERATVRSESECEE
jgi:hypothetical protein